MENPLAISPEESAPLTVEEYLRGAVAYEVDAAAIRSILYRRGLDGAMPVCVILPTYGEGEFPDAQKQLDLALADILMWCATAPSSKHDTEDADGGWKHKGGGWQSTSSDKRELRRQARELYAKWGESLATNTRMQILNF